MHLAGQFRWTYSFRNLVIRDHRRRHRRRRHRRPPRFFLPGLEPH